MEKVEGGRYDSNNFELIIPWLEKWSTENPGSVVDWGVDADNHIQHVFICPWYTGTIFQHVDPVDPTHLWPCYKGTIYIYSELTGSNDIYMYAFDISMGNEDYTTWMFSTTCFLDHVHWCLKLKKVRSIPNLFHIRLR